VNKLISLPIVLLASLTLTGCSLVNNAIVPKWEQSQPGEWNQEVADFLPKGSYLVEGCVMPIRDSEVCVQGDDPTVKGYVNFVDEIDGKGCESKYEASFLPPGASPLYFTVVRSANERAYQQQTFESGEKSEWTDATDMSLVIDWIIGFNPFVLSGAATGISDNSAQGILCSVQLLPRFMNLVDDQLVYDLDRVRATDNALNDRLISAPVDAAGIEGRSRDLLLNSLSKRYASVDESSMSLTEDFIVKLVNRPIYLTKNSDKSFEIIQQTVDNDLLVKLTFTPTSKQVVEKVPGVKSEQKVIDEIATLREQGVTQEQIVKTILGL
jgi:hypothetical protein